MAGIKDIFKVSVVALAIPAVAFGAQRDNPRGAAVIRGGAVSDNSAASVISRSVSKDGRQSRSAVNSQGVKARSARPVAPLPSLAWIWEWSCRQAEPKTTLCWLT